MSFSPWPAEFVTFLQDLQSRKDPRILDLGSGQGDFSFLLKDFNLQIWGLDRLPKVAGVVADLQADALDPPILPGSLDCLLAGNLVRHLLTQNKSGSFLSRWLELLRPGGCLFLFEDEPGESIESEKNYFLLQAFLSQVMPATRGPLLSRKKFCDVVSGITPQQAWNTGFVENTEKPDSVAVISMLKGGANEIPASGPVGRLVSDIENHGLSYGSYWWAQARFL